MGKRAEKSWKTTRKFHKAKHSYTQGMLTITKYAFIAIAIILAILALNFGRSKIILTGSQNVSLAFYRYEIQETDIAVEYPSNVLARITPTAQETTLMQNTGLVIQYKIDYTDANLTDVDWTTYNSANQLEILDNCTISCRFYATAQNASGAEFIGPVTTKTITLPKITTLSGTTLILTEAGTADTTDAFAKASDYYGEVVSYSDGNTMLTYRLFYVDFEDEDENGTLDGIAKYGDATGTMYLMADYDKNLTRTLSTYSGNYDSSDASDSTMKINQMNPLWAEQRGVSSAEWNNNEKSAAYLCDTTQWTTYKNNDANYAIGGASTEMYIDSYNQSGIDTEELGYAYQTSNTPGYVYTVDGVKQNSGWYTNSNTLELNKMYTNNGSGYWWLATPSAYSADYVCSVGGGNRSLGSRAYSNTNGVRPLVSLKQGVIPQITNYVEFEGTDTTTPVRYYATLAQAMTGVTNGNTIAPLQDITETTAATLAEGKTATLDLNGKTTTFNISAESADTSAITNEGTLTITDNTQATEATDEYSYTFKDGTKLEIGGTLKSNKVAVTNNGTATIEGTANIHGTGNDTYTIVNEGTMTVESGTIRSTNYRTIVNGESNTASATITINDGTIISANQGVTNVSNLNQVTGQTVNAQAVKITGGKIESQVNAIVNADASTGLIYITGGEIIGGAAGGVTPTVYNGGNGKIIIDEVNSANTMITDYSTNAAIYNGYVSGATGTVEIRKGTIVSKGGKGVNNSKSGTTLIIGTDEVAAGETTSVSTTVPSITGATYGVYRGDGTFKFYDGIIKGVPGAPGLSIAGGVHNKPADYTVKYGTEIIDGTTYETATLQKSIPDTIINTESMYVPGAQVRLDGVHNWIGNDKEGKNYEATTWADISGSGNNGAITSNTLKWGENYLEFDGSSTWVDLGTQMNYQTITMETTISPDTFGQSRYILNNFEGAGYALYLTSGGKVGLAIKFNEDSNTKYYASDTTLEVGKIYHIVVTLDGSKIKIFINGQLDKSIDYNYTIKNSTVNMVLGANSDTSMSTLTGPYDGKIFSAAVYNRALTADEVVQNATASLALAGGTVSTPNLTYTIRFPDAVTGFTADDITLTNGTKGTFTEVTAGKVYNLDAALATNSTTNTAITQRITVAQAAATISGTPTSEASRTVAIAPAYKNTTTNKCYFKLQDAFNEVNAGETIQALRSTIESATTLSKGTTSNPVTLDLNGKTIAASGVITNYGVLTIKDTSTNSNGEIAGNSYIINTYGNLNILSGTLSTTGVSAVRNYSNNNIINISGGTISSSATSNSYGTIYNNKANAQINISGGTIIGVDFPIYMAGGSDASSLNITGGTITASRTCAIYNNGSGATVTVGTVNALNNNEPNIAGGICGDKGCGLTTVNSGTITDATDKTISSYGSITINGGLITGSRDHAIYSKGSGTVTISGGEVKNTGAYAAVYNNAAGTIDITGGIVRNTGTYRAINNASTGTINISGGTITTAANHTVVNASTGEIDVSGDAIIRSLNTASNYCAIHNSGTLEISGTSSASPTISTAKGDAVYNDGSGSITMSEGNITGTAAGLAMGNGTAAITGGTISATAGVGIYSSGTLTIGSNDTNTPLTTPTISGTTYGVQATGTFNFYDGQITGAHAKSISISPTAIPTGYGVVKTHTSTTETAKLDRAYTLTVNPNGGTYEGSTSAVSPTIKLVHGMANHNELRVATKTGYTLTGYYTAASGGTKVYEPDGKATKWTSYWKQDTSGFYADGIYDGTGDLTVYAQWRANVLTVNYKANGATRDTNGNAISDTFRTDTFNYGATRTGDQWPLDYQPPWGHKLVRDGYTPTPCYIIGSADSSNTMPQDLSASITSSVNNIADRLGVLSQLEQGDTTVNIYAGWTPVTYSITYNLDGGSLASGVTNPTSYNIESENITLNAPTKTGYTFAGWKENQDGITSATDIASSNAYSLNGNTYTFTNTTSGNTYSGFKMQIWTKQVTDYRQIFPTTTTLGKFKVTYTNTLDTGEYYFRMGANGSKSDDMGWFYVYLEKDATYVYEYELVSYSSSQIVVKDVKFYKQGSGNVAIPVDIIPTGSYGNRSYTAIWK